VLLANVTLCFQNRLSLHHSLLCSFANVTKIKSSFNQQGGSRKRNGSDRDVCGFITQKDSTFIIANEFIPHLQVKGDQHDLKTSDSDYPICP
jgi:hypothetical protein